MAAKYCSREGCGGKTEWNVKQPVTCAKCGQPFAKAFVGVVAATPSVTPVTRSTSTTSSSRPAVSSRPRPTGDDESDYYNKQEMKEMASELAASISVSDFGLVLKDGGNGGSFRIEDVLDPKKQVEVGQRGTVTTELPPQSE